jgi:hypothetical protein
MAMKNGSWGYDRIQSAFMKLVARNLTDMSDGFLLIC